MKFYYVLYILLCFTACCSEPNDFVLRGTVPGAMDSTEVRLTSEQLSPRLAITGYIVNEKFELRGKLDRPMLCRLSMNNEDEAQRRGVKEEDAVKYVEANFFLENGDLSFYTPHIDSLPRSFWRYDPMRETNYRVKGSKSQEVYACYQQVALPLEARRQSLDRKYRKSEDAGDYKALCETEALLENAIWMFIGRQQHPDVDLFLAHRLLKEPFTYDQAYLDRLEAVFAPCPDTLAALQEFRAELQKAAAFVQGTPLKEGLLRTVAGDSLSLLKLPMADHYTLIDFWASWCMPCRGSFPHLRKMHQAYCDKVQFVSISIDKKESDWKEALEEEKLPWAQYLTTPAFYKTLGEYYGIQAVPTFLLVDPQGRIVFSGHDGGELESVLGKLQEHNR